MTSRMTVALCNMAAKPVKQKQLGAECEIGRTVILCINFFLECHEIFNKTIMLSYMFVDKRVVILHHQLFFFVTAFSEVAGKVAEYQANVGGVAGNRRRNKLIYLVEQMSV